MDDSRPTAVFGNPRARSVANVWLVVSDPSGLHTQHTDHENNGAMRFSRLASLVQSLDGLARRALSTAELPSASRCAHRAVIAGASARN